MNLTQWSNRKSLLSPVFIKSCLWQRVPVLLWKVAQMGTGGKKEEMLEGKPLAALDWLSSQKSLYPWFPKLSLRSEQWVVLLAYVSAAARRGCASSCLCHFLRYFYPHLGLHSCIASILLTALTFICHLAGHEGSQYAWGLQFLCNWWHLCRQPGAAVCAVGTELCVCATSTGGIGTAPGVGGMRF